MLLRSSSAPVLTSLVSEGDHDCPSFNRRDPLPPNRVSCNHSLLSMRRACSEPDLPGLVHSFAEAQQQHLSIIQEGSTSFSNVNTPRLKKEGFIVIRKPCSKQSAHPAPRASSQVSAPCVDDEQLSPLLMARGISAFSKPEDLMTMNAGGGVHGHDGGRGGSGGSSGRSSSPQGDSNTTDLYYQRLLQADPQNPLFLRNYAEFLCEKKHDYKKSEEYYERAILACPSDGEVLSKYAQQVWEVHKDSQRAGTYFDQAVRATPDDCYVLASHASFLWQSEECEEDNDKYSQSTFLPVASPLMASA